VRFVGSVAATSQLSVPEVFQIVVGAAGFLAGHAAEAAIDRLSLEGGAGRLDLGEDVPPRERGGAPVRWCSRSMASRMAFRQLGRLSATLACIGDTLIRAPSMVSWRFVLCNPSPPTKPQVSRLFD
jgi:hypothetical protein